MMSANWWVEGGSLVAVIMIFLTQRARGVGWMGCGVFFNAAIRAPRVPRGFSGVFIRGFPPNKKTTRQRIKTKDAEGWLDGVRGW